MYHIRKWGRFCLTWLMLNGFLCILLLIECVYKLFMHCACLLLSRMNDKHFFLIKNSIKQANISHNMINCLSIKNKCKPHFETLTVACLLHIHYIVDLHHENVLSFNHSMPI